MYFPSFLKGFQLSKIISDLRVHLYQPRQSFLNWWGGIKGTLPCLIGKGVSNCTFWGKTSHVRLIIIRERPKNTPSPNLRNLDNFPLRHFIRSPYNQAGKNMPKVEVGNSFRGGGESWKTDFSYIKKKIIFASSPIKFYS